MFRFVNIDQDEITDGQPGSAAAPEAASQGGIDAAAAAAHSGAPKPQPEAKPEPAKPAAENAQAPAVDQVTLMVDGKQVSIPRAVLEAMELDQEVNGKKFKLPLKEVVARSQRFENFTQKEQEVAGYKKDLAAKIAKFDAMIAERASDPENQTQEELDKTAQLEAEVKELKDWKEQQAAAEKTAADKKLWDDTTAPVLQKFPGVGAKELRERFLERCEAAAAKGEAALAEENTAAGLERAAESLMSEKENTVNERLDKLLADPENPKVKAYREKVILEFTKGKVNLADAGGEHGGAGAGGTIKKIGGLADAEAAALKSN